MKYLTVILIANILLAACNHTPDTTSNVIKYSKTDAISLLNKNGVSVSVEGLTYCASQADLPNLRLLLDAGVGVNALGLNGTTALHIAAWTGNKDVAEILLDNKADTNIVDSTGATPLLLAASQEHEDLVKLLLSKGAQVDAANNDGSTALMEAIWKDNVEITQLILAAGADTKKIKKDGTSVLQQAQARGKTEIVSLVSTHAEQ